MKPCSTKVTMWPIDRVVPYINNAKSHPPEQVDKIAGSIAEFGFDQPIVVDGDGIVIKGHGRLLAARKLGLSSVPVLVRTDLTPAQVKAARIADNRVAQSPWDNAMLALDIGELKALDVDLGVLGFDPAELGALLAPPATVGLVDPDDAPEPPADPVTRLGDVWLLGRHRLVCGDSTDADTVARCLNGARPHLMVTDPPYGVEYDADWRNKALKMGKVTKDGRAVGKVRNDDNADWSAAYALFPGDVAYVWSPPGPLQDVFYHSLIDSGFEIRAQIIWVKSQFVIGRGHYHGEHEPCWYAVRSRAGATGHWQGARDQSTVWRIDKPRKSETGHSTQKPVECMRRPIENNSARGDAIYEPFSGSGTTIIAAEQTGRRAYAIELEPKYVDVAVRRWQTFTGLAATLEGDDGAFDDFLLCLSAT